MTIVTAGPAPAETISAAEQIDHLEFARSLIEAAPTAQGSEIYRGVQIHNTAGTYWFVAASAASGAIVAHTQIERVRSEVDSQVWLLDLQSEIQRERRN